MANQELQLTVSNPNHNIFMVKLDSIGCLSRQWVVQMDWLVSGIQSSACIVLHMISSILMSRMVGDFRVLQLWDVSSTSNVESIHLSWWWNDIPSARSFEQCSQMIEPMMNCFPESGCSPARETQVEVGFPNAISPPEKKKKTLLGMVQPFILFGYFQLLVFSCWWFNILNFLPTTQIVHEVDRYVDGLNIFKPYMSIYANRLEPLVTADFHGRPWGCWSPRWWQASFLGSLYLAKRNNSKITGNSKWRHVLLTKIWQHELLFPPICS